MLRQEHHHAHVTTIDCLLASAAGSSAYPLLVEAKIGLSNGAYRGAVVSLFLAAVHDFRAKLELQVSDAGTSMAKEASKLLSKWREHHATRNWGAIWSTIERELPKLLHKFSIITSTEIEDWNRLVVDRDRSTHPVFTDEGEMWTPGFDLVSMHFNTVVKQLITREISYGSTATVEKMVLEITSRISFPITTERALRLLQVSLRNYDKLFANPLAYAALLRAKHVMAKGVTERDYIQCRSAIEALCTRHDVRTMFRTKSASWLRDLDDKAILHPFFRRLLADRVRVAGELVAGRIHSMMQDTDDPVLITSFVTIAVRRSELSEERHEWAVNEAVRKMRKTLRRLQAPQIESMSLKNKDRIDLALRLFDVTSRDRHSSGGFEANNVIVELFLPPHVWRHRSKEQHEEMQALVNQRLPENRTNAVAASVRVRSLEGIKNRVGF